MSSRHWKKIGALLFGFLCLLSLSIAASAKVLATQGPVVPPVAALAVAPPAVPESTCEAESCEKATYSLKIIKHGESLPRAENTTSKGRQENRRVDVTLAKKVGGVEPEKRNVELDSGGTIWVTKDPASLQRTLEVETAATAQIDDSGLLSPLNFRLHTNYGAFLSRWEVLLYKVGSTDVNQPVATLSAGQPGLFQEVEWDGFFQNNAKGEEQTLGERTTAGKGMGLFHGLELEYALRAYDAEGNYDQTPVEKLRLIATGKDSENRRTELTIGKLTPNLALNSSEESSSQIDSSFFPQASELAVEGVVVRGAKVRVHGIDIKSRQGLTINGEKVLVGSDNEFVVEYLLPGGRHEFVIANGSSADAEISERLSIDLDTDYFFMVGMADLTFGKNKVSGSVEPLAVDEHHYGGDIFVDGRLAFYLKGKIKGKYLITAQMDTGIEDVEEVFDDFHRKDPNSVFRRLDPDQYYLVYGDDSNVYEDTDSQGKFYFRADWDRSRVLWGNFNTAFSGTEFAPFNRSLYGAQIVHRNVSNTSLGDPKTEFSGFASKAQTAFRHNEFLGTGGSLYYLRDKDIVRGSEKVWVEVRQSVSDRVIQKIPLISGRDYDLDDFQGRLILSRPLLSISSQSGPSIIRDEPLADDNTFLVVDYEFVPDNFDTGQASVGARGKTWLGDHLAIGGTWAHENRESEDYDIKGVDLTLKKSKNTYLKGEIARSESSQSSGSFRSLDGGLNFSGFNSNENSGNGDAFGVEARVSSRDFSDNVMDITAAAWFKNRKSGFSTASLDTGSDTTDVGVEVSSALTENLQLTAQVTQVDRKEESRESLAALQIEVDAASRLTVSGELRHVSDENMTLSTKSDATLAAGKLSYDLSENSSFFTSAQRTLSKSGGYLRNNQMAVGANVKLDDRLKLSGEVNTGDRGDGIRAGFDWSVNDSYSLYSNVSSTFSTGKPSSHVLTAGQRKTVSNQLQVYSEHQFTHEDKQQGLSHTLGLDHSFNRYLSASVSLQMARIEDEGAGTTDRDAASLGLDYKHDKLNAGHRLEYRRDRAANLATDQWVVTNRFEYRKSPSTRWQGKLNASTTTNALQNSRDARFVEAGLGFAFRPVNHDRLNMLGRLTYLYDLAPIDQEATPATDTRAVIGSIEMIYDISQRWSIGGKLAHRNGETRTARVSGGWIGNDASLAATRIHYRVNYGFEAMFAYHWLLSDASDNLRQGTLLSLGRRVGDHLKFAVGYNFANFDDNLTEDDYDVRGWFFNLVGTY